MKKLALLLMLTMAFLMSNSAVHAYPVSQGQFVYFTDAGGTTNGGPFGVFDYSTDTLLFTTFCVERNEYLTFGKSATVAYVVGAINTGAVNGGLGGGNPDPLDKRSAYLYHTWATSVTGWNVDDLQKAIWYIEGEMTGTNALVALAEGQWSDIGPVRVLNMEKWTRAVGSDWTLAEEAQDVIVTPEPGTMLLLGFGLVGLTMVGGRRFFKKD
jgi:hypothetical protein